jgi:uncharacterized protein (TIGR02284 family)
MQTTHEIESTVHHLIEICRDGQKGFEAAAKAIDDSVLRAELMQYSVQRQEFAGELDSALDERGDVSSTNENGTVSGALHRGWMNIKAAVASNDVHVILAECERGEDSAVEAYRDAVYGILSPKLESIVESQYEQVERVHDRIKTLRDAARA